MSDKETYLFLYTVVSDNYGGTYEGEFFPTEKLNEADFVIQIERNTGASTIIKSRYGNGGKVSDAAFWEEAYQKGKQDCRNEIRDANLEVVHAIENLAARPITTRTFLWAVNRRMEPAAMYEEKKEVPENRLFRISKIRAYGTEDSLAHVRLTMILPRGNAFESIPLIYFLQERNMELDSVQTATVRLECDAQANALVEVIFEGVQSQ